MSTQRKVIPLTENTVIYDPLNRGKFAALYQSEFLESLDPENNQKSNNKAEQVSMDQNNNQKNQLLVDLKNIETKSLELKSMLQQLQEKKFHLITVRNAQKSDIINCVGQKLAQANSIFERLFQSKIMRKNGESPNQISKKNTSKTYPSQRQLENHQNQSRKEGIQPKVSQFGAQNDDENKQISQLSQKQENLSKSRLSAQGEKCYQGMARSESSNQSSDAMYCFEVTETQRSSDSQSSGEFQQFYSYIKETQKQLEHLLHLN